MRLLIITHDSERYSTFIEDWADRNNHEYRICNLIKEERYPNATEFDWLIVLGGSQHAWEEDIHPWLQNEKDFINDSVAKNKIMLGICFGAQLVAEVLGGKVFPNTHPEIGWSEVFLSPEGEKSFLFQNVPNKFISFHWHYDHYSLPPDCTRLAYTEPTPNQAFSCNNFPVVGLQFHPEFKHSSIKYFCEAYGDQLVNGRYAADKQTILAQMDLIAEQDWLLDLVLDNLVNEYG